MQKVKKLATALMLISSPAWAGEVTGNGQLTPIGEASFLDPHASSICSFSGQGDGDVNMPDPNPRVQSYGQLVRAFGGPPPIFIAPNPGISCNGHTGFFSG